jgi:hypothetical protein
LGYFYNSTQNLLIGFVDTAHFNDTTINKGSIGTNADFYNTSKNEGVIVSYASFWDNSTNKNPLGSNPQGVYLHNYSSNLVSAQDVFMAYFYNYATNYGGTSVGYFYNDSVNYGFSYYATDFYNNSINRGSCGTSTTFRDSTINYGDCSSSDFYEFSINNGNCTYWVNFNGYSVNNGYAFGPYFKGYSVNSYTGTIGIDCVFNDFSRNEGILVVSAFFMDSSYNYSLGDISNAEFYNTSYNQGLVDTATFHSDSYNQGIVDTAIFQNDSYSVGQIITIGYFRESSTERSNAELQGSLVWRDTGLVTVPETKNVELGVGFGAGQSEIGTALNGIDGSDILRMP